MRFKTYRSPLALESRVMFDAAALAMAAEALAQEVDHVSPDAADGLDSETSQGPSEAAALGAALNPTPASGPQMVFVADDVPNLAQFLSQLPAGMQVVVLDSTRDGLQQMADALRGQQDVSGIHLVTHGNSGQLQLGSTLFDPTQLNDAQSALLADIGSHLAGDADLLIYGCDFGAGDNGSAAVGALASALGVDLAASNDATGSSSLGGDWDLEVRQGEVTLQALSAADWEGLLTSQSVTMPEDHVLLGTVPVLLGVAQVTDAPNHGTVVVTAGGAYTYTPHANYNGTDSFTVKSYNVLGILTSSTTVNITVTAVNDAPTALGLSPRSGQDGGAVSIATASRFTDVDGDTLSYSASGLPSGLSINSSTGVISGTLAANASAGGVAGVYTVTVTASDGKGGSTSQTLALTVSNPGPTAVNDSATTAEDTAVSGNVLANDSDDDALTASLSTGPLNGTVTLAANGSYTYTPNANYNGSDSFTYRVTDAQGAFSLATVHITVTAVNDGPLVASPLGTVAQTTGVALNVAAAAGFSDADVATSGQVLTYSATGLPAGVTINSSTGLITGTPTVAGNYTVTVTATDNLGASVNQNLLLQLTPPNLPPVGLPLAAALAQDGSAFSYNAGSAFSDPNGDALAFSASGLPAGLSINASTGVISGTPSATASAGGVAGVYTVTVTASDGKGGSASQVLALTVGNPSPNAVNDTATTAEDNAVSGNVLTNDSDDDALTASLHHAPSHGSVTVAANGSYTYTPAANFNGTDSFTVRITDAQGASTVSTVTITVTPGNDGPVAGSLSNRSGNDGAAISIAAGSAFSDADGDALSYSATGLPPGLSINASTGVISGTLAAHASAGGAAGVYAITVTASDGNGGTATQSFNFTASNPGPWAMNDGVSTTEDTAVTGNLLANDSDDDSFTATLATGPAHGTVTLAANGSYTYTPGPNYNGSDSFTYTVTDAQGATATATVSITIAAVNDAPTTVGSLSLTSVLTTDVLSIATAGAFADVDVATNGQGLVYSATGLPAGVSINASTGVVVGTPLVAGSYNAVITVTDSAGAAANQVLSLVVSAPNLPPVGLPLAAALAQDGSAFSYNAGSAFSDPNGDALAFSASGLPAGLSINASTGVISGTPSATASAGGVAGVYTVTVTASDGHGGSASQVLALTVGNPSPQAADDAASTAEDTAVSGNVLANDSDDDALTASLHHAPSHGSVTVAADGSYTYTPAANFNGSDSFTVRVTDAQGASSLSVVQVTVTPVNDGPVAGSLSNRSGNDGSSVSIATAGGFSDADGNALSYSASGLPPGLSINASTGVISGTLAANASAGGAGGVYTVQVSVNDGQGASASQTFTFTASNPGPTANADVAVTNEDTAVSGNVLANDSDDDALTASLASGPTQGTVVLNANGSYTYTPNANANGGDQFTYTVTDAQGRSASATVSINILPINDAPSISAALSPISANTGQALSVATAAAFGDADGLTNGDVLVYSASGLPTGVTINASTGVVSGIALLAGNYSATITATDLSGASVSQALNLQIGLANLAPIGLPLGAALAQDGAAFSYNAGLAFTDPNGDALAFSASGLPSGLSINASTGVISGTPVAHASAGGVAGVYTVTVTASDGKGGSASQVLALAVGNPGPNAVADSASGLEDTVISGNVLANDSDDDSLSAALLTPALNGSVSVAANGAYTYTPHANFNGTDSFTYTVTDSQGATAVTTVTVTVGAVNDAPTLSGSALGTVMATVGTPMTVVTATAFADADVATNGQVLTYSASGLPNGLSINASTGVIVGTTLDVGTHPVNVTVTDAAGASISQTLTLQLSAAHAPPVAVVDTATTHTNTAVNIDVLANDVVAMGDTLSVTGATAANGSVTLNGDGTITYTPNAGFNGVDTIQYTVRDSTGADALLPGLVTVTVSPQNISIQLPTLINLLNEDQPLLVVGLGGNKISIGDINGNLISVTLSVATGDLTLGSTANLTLADGDGVSDSSLTFSGLATDINAALAGLIYTPGADYNGPVTINVTALDTLLGLPVITAQLPIGIAPVADVVDDTALLVQDQPVSLNVLANDNFENPSRAVTSFTQGAHGSVTIDANGNAVYTPNPGYYGPDSFTYTVTSNGTTETATVTLTVDARPIAADPLPTRVAIDGQVQNFNVAAAFSDPDGDTLSYSASGLPPGLSLNAATGQITGTLTANASAGGTSGAYAVNITANDGKGGTLTRSFTFTVTNPGPTAVNDSASGAEDTTLTGNVLGNDSDDDSLSASLATGPSHGTVTLNADGSYVYTPTANFNGTDTFTYTVTDAQGATATATVTLTVTPVNDTPTASGTPLAARSAVDSAAVSINTASAFTDADGQALSFSATGLPAGLAIDPATGAITGTLGAAASAGGTGGVYAITVTANDGNGGTSSQTFNLTVTNPGPTALNDTLSLDEDTTAGGNVLANDSDDDALTVAIATPPANGSVLLAPDGSYSYTPNANFNGSDSFTYTITDAQGATSTATVTVTVAAVNDGPTGSGSPLANASGQDGQAVSIATAGAFADPDGPAPTYSALGLPPGLAIDPSTGVISGTLAAAASAGGTAGVYNITVMVSDSLGGTASQSFTFTASNPGPNAQADSGSGNEDTAISGNVLANDSDDDTLSASLASGPSHGSVSFNADGSYTYTPDANYSGSDSFTYTVTDAQGATATATVTLTIAAVNDSPAPSSSPLAAESGQDGSAVSIATAPAFADPDGPALSYSATGLPPGLSIDAATGLISGTLTAAASAGGAGGVYTVTVTASDGAGGSSSQSFTFTASNPGPMASDDNVSVAEGGSVSAQVLMNDVDDDALTASLASAPAHGTLVFNTDGTYTYTPTPGYNGSDTFTYTATDAQGASATATVTITVVSVNTPPSPSGTPLANASLTDGQVVSINAAAAFSDPDGPALSYSATGLPTGLAIDPATGLISGTLPPDASAGGTAGVYTVTVTADDGGGGVSAQTVQFTIGNPGPSAANDTASGGEDTAITGNVLANDSDDDSLTASLASGPAHGSVTLNADGSYSYIASANFNGSDSFTYTVTDAQGATATATVSITVTPINDAPAPSSTPLTAKAANDGQAVAIGTASGFVDAEGQTLSYSATGLPPGLVINPVNGVISGTLAANASAGGTGGVYSVTVTASDGAGGLGSQTFSFTANNPGPTANADSLSVVGGSSASGNVLANDSDDDTLTAALNAPPSNGNVTVSADGSYTYAPNLGFSGTDTFTYTVTDAQGASATATVTVTVSPAPNTAPTASGTPLVDRSAADGQTVSVPTAGAFTDGDGDALSYSATGLPPGLSIDPATGVISGTVAANASAGGAAGVYAVTVTADDGRGGVSSQTFNLSTSNPGPTAADDSGSGAEDSAITGNVLANDSDDDALSASLATPPSHGSVVVAADGTYTYTPDANFNGTDTFTYTVTDAQGLSTTATVTVAVTAVNDAPVVSSTPLAARAAADGDALAFGTALGFTDAEGDTLSYSATGLPPGLTINASTGVISGTLAANASAGGTAGVYSVTVTANDGNGGTLAQTFDFTASNPGPNASDDTLNATSGIASNGNVLANDSDDDGLTATLGSGPANGTLTLNSDGSYSYTPNAGFTGTDSFTYTATDAQGATATATVTIAVSAAPNSAPTASGSPLADTSGADGQPVLLPVSGAFTDGDGDTLSYSATGLPPGLMIDPVNGVITGTLSAAASAGGSGGVYNVTVTADDGRGGLSSQTFAFTATNPGPNAVNDSATAAEDGSVSGNVLANDSDDDTLSAALATGPSNGTVTLNSDGSYTYAPDANFNGTDTFTYTVTDAQGATSTATVTVTVTAANDAPSASPTPLSATTGADGSPVTLDTAGAFTDLDGDTLTYSATGLPPGLSIDPATGVISGTLPVDASGAAPGGLFTVTVTADDGNGGTLSQTFTFTATNPGPNAVNDSATAAEDGSVSGNVLANDSDDDTLSAALATGPSNGTVTLNSDGSYTYTPNADFNGTDTFTYTVTDAQGATSTATVTVTVTAGNDAPTASPAPLSASTAADGSPVTLDTAGAFTDLDGDTLTYSATGLPPGLSIDPATGVISGTLPVDASGAAPGGLFNVTVTADDGNGGTLSQTFTFTATNPGPAATDDAATVAEDGSVTGNVLDNDSDDDTFTATLDTAPTNGSVTFNPDGSYTYTPDADFNGTDTFTYTVTDAQGATSTATVTVTVTATNDAPTASPAPLSATTGADGSPVTLDTAGAFTDLDGDTLSFTATGLPPGLTIDPATGVISGTLPTDASAAVPGGQFNVTVTADDGNGGTLSQTFAFTATNPGPTAADDTATVAENSTVSGNVLSNDSDDDAVSATLATPPANGSVTLNPDGSYTYAPNAGFSGVDTFTYTLTDAQGATATATVTVTVVPSPNEAPTASPAPLVATTAADGSAVNLPTAPAFADADGDTLSFSATGLPPGLAIDPATGVISGTLPTDASAAVPGGQFNVTVTANDGNGGTLSQSFTLTATNPGPNATDDVATVAEDGSVTGNVLANDGDDDTLTAALATGPSNGSVTLNPDGSYTYTPNADFNGTDTFTYTVTDAQGATATTMVSVTVTSVNDAPVANGPALANVNGVEGQAVTLNAALPFSDADGDTLSYSAAGLPAGLSIDPATGVISGTLDPSAASGGNAGVYTVTVTAADGNGGTVSQSFTLTATNPPPVATPLAASTAEDTPISGNVLSGATDDDPLTASLAAPPANGTVTLNPDGSYTYTPNADFNGTDSFSFTVTDSQGEARTATVTITVEAQNDAPTDSDAPLTATNAPVGQPITLSTAEAFVDVDGDALSFSADGLPPGLTLDPATGVITGTPAQAGTFTVTVTASDPSGAVATQTFIWTIDPAPTVVTAGAGTNAADTNPVTAQSLRTASYDPVLIKAVNDVKRLGGTEALAGSQSLGTTVGGVQNLSASADLNQSSPMAAVVGDLSEGFKAPATVDGTLGNGFGTGVSAQDPAQAASLSRLDQGLAAAGLQPLDPLGPQAAAAVPETLAELLVKDQRRRRDELDDLARALG